jgi:hypothetical protein
MLAIMLNKLSNCLFRIGVATYPSANRDLSGNSNAKHTHERLLLKSVSRSSAGSRDRIATIIGG